MPSLTSSKSVRQFFQTLGWKSSPDQEQAVLRIFMPLSFICFLLLFKPAASAPNAELWHIGIRFISLFLVFAIAVLISTLRSPAPSVLRRLWSILLDIGSLSYGLYLTGELGAPWYGVYLWVTLGNGFRYGENYIYLSGAASLAGFTTVAMLSPFWAQHQHLAIGLAATLLLVPAYSARLIRRLNEARKQADMANQAKSRFLSRMSHEIRTPLNGVLGMAELLKGMPLDRQAQQYVHIIETSGQALHRQIDEVLDLSKIEAEQLTIENIEFDLYILVGQTLQMFETQAAQQDVRLCEQLDPLTPFLIQGDPYRLQQILINLLSNAVKFTREGTVTLRVSPGLEENERVVLHFEVIDTGIGMEPEAVNSVFEPFRQANATITREFGGTGLGTTICKSLIELMGGQIGVHSLPESGTTFWFNLPFIRGELPQEDDKNWKKRCRTLYVRHTQQRDSRIPGLLNQWRIPFRQTTSLNMARELVKTGSGGAGWDAVVIDAWPYDDELDAVLCDYENGNHSPALILAGGKGYPPSLLGRRRQNLYLIDVNASSTQLSNALHASYVKHNDDIVHIASAIKPSQCEAGDRHRLRLLVSDDNPTNRLVVEQMLKRLGHGCDLVEGGEAALYALEDGDYDAVLVDKNMPDMGGIEVLKAYRYAQAGKDTVPFILLTADATEDAKSQAEKAGVAHFLTKPLSIGRLQAALEAVTPHEVSTSRDESSREETINSSGSVEMTNETDFDPAILKELVSFSAEPDEFASKLISSFKRDAVSNIAGMENAVHDGNHEAFRDFAHALKGSASYVGLVKLEGISQTIETIDADEFKRNSLSLFRQLKNEVEVGIKALDAQWHPSRQVS